MPERVRRYRERARTTPEPRAHTSTVGRRRPNRRSAVDGRIVLRTERLLLTPLTRLDEAEHASASGRPADALRDTGAAEGQWRGGGVGPPGGGGGAGVRVRTLGDQGSARGEVPRMRGVALGWRWHRWDRAERGRGGLVGSRGA